jgi:hypothetical protein
MALGRVDQQADAGAVHEPQLRGVHRHGSAMFDRRPQRPFERLHRAEVQISAQDDRARHGLGTDPERPLNQLDLRGLGRRIDDAKNA